MFDRLSTDDIRTALDELVTSFGVREDVPVDDLAALLRKKDIEGCVQQMAARLGLPVRIDLSYVPKDFRPGTSNGFRSSALSRTDGTGHGTFGITAQVHIPEHLPMFGTSELQDFPIRVRVSENCDAHPDTFLTVMVHELAHVLLASVRHRHRDSELHTDLVPILLGFRDILWGGRKTVESTTSGNVTTTRTTTYGYLTDSQFQFACIYTADLVIQQQSNKKHLTRIVGRVNRKLKQTERSLAAFRDYLAYLDKHPPTKMAEEHAKRVVQLHAQDSTYEWQNRVTSLRTSAEAAESFVHHLTLYTNRAIEDLKAHIQSVESASRELAQITEEMTKDIKILRRYVGFAYRLRKALGRRER